MKRYQTILVGAALDDRDATTLRHAACFAQAARSKAVYVAHVAPSFDPPATEKVDFLPRDEEIESQLAKLIEENRSLFPAETKFQAVARQGPLALELIRLASQKSADLFCLSSRPALTHDPLSHTALQLMRKSPCSVFIIPPGTTPSYDRILVPIDFSDFARESLDVACAIAQAMPQASLTLQHTYDVPLGWHKSGRTYEEFAEIMKHNAQERWEHLRPQIDFHGVSWTIRYDLGENVAKTILDVAQEIDARLIVMGSHGRTQPANFLLGHVADIVCSHSDRPVICVKKKGAMVNLLHALLQFYGFEDQ